MTLVEPAFQFELDSVVGRRATLAYAPEVLPHVHRYHRFFGPDRRPGQTQRRELHLGTLGAPPPVAGIEGPCDMFAFHEFGIRALWGPRGGNTHAADEYVEIDSVVDAAKVLLLFVCEWCE